MSFLKKLFGGGGDTPTGPAASEEYKGYAIAATPFASDGQYQVCGTISKTIDGAAKSHRFIRADRFASMDEAATFSLVKARQIIDQMGDRVFQA